LRTPECALNLSDAAPDPPGCYDDFVRLRILAFASACDAVGAARSELVLAPGARVADLRRELLVRHPALAPLLPRLAIAVDGEIVNDDRELSTGVEIALLPPVSGG
jgi:molybdopterin synthase sulfur carrier subunit